MSHREEPEEAGLIGPPPHRSKQPNGTPLEGGRPRWRPCQLHNLDAEGQGHHHHHQANLHTSGSSRGPPRHRRRHAPGEAQRRRAESGDTEARAGQQPKPGASRHHRSGERLHQHRYRQQHKEEEEEQVVKSPPKEQASEPLSPEEPLTPSPQDEPITDGLDGNSPDLSHSSDTHIDRDPEPESSMKQLEEKVQSEESKLGEEELVKENQEKDYFRETPEQDYAPPKIASKSRPESKRTSPLRVDVPPFATSPRQMMNKPFFQSPRTFPETLRSHNSDPKSYPAHFNTGYAHTSKDKGFESPMSHAEDHQEDLSDSSPEACTVSHPEESPTEHQTESYLTDPPPALEGPQTYERHQSVTTEECDPQEDIDQRTSVGSRLHHYNEQSGDEAESSGRVRAQVRKTSSSTSLSQEAPPEEETSETAQLSPDLQVEVVERPDKTSTPAQDQITEACRATGDAVSLAIKDIKEAIEEVKTKTVRSPYTPDKITEPVWVMRQDVSPVEENPPQLQPQVHSHPQSPCQLSQSSPQYAAPVQDAELPLGAESSGVHHQDQDLDISPSVPSEEKRRSLASFPTYVDVPGPCDPDDLIDGIIFAANYLGFTQLLSERTPTKSGRMQQAQEAMSRVRTAQTQARIRNKYQQGSESGPAASTEVDLFISTQRIKVLSAYTQDTMMDHPLRTISYIADIGNMVVLMARRKMIRSQSAQESLDTAETQHTNPARDDCRQYRMICHVFESEDAQLIAQSIGQAFSVAYQEFLRANGIDPEDLSQREYSDLLNTQDMYNDDLIHFSKSENCRDVYIEKQKGEILGVVIVESGWGSILPTVIIASLMHGAPAAKSGRLNIGDQIMTVNGTSLVGLPLSTCQSIIKGLKAQSRIKMNIVRCPPVTMVLIRRPDLRYQLGFSVQNGIICSLMRGGIAERGGVRVGHRIIEINGQSVVATAHEKIVHILSNAVGEVKTRSVNQFIHVIQLNTPDEKSVIIH
ncbi:amyloid-beta A4 precursor protein-binding family A member 1-like isoform X1 [Cyprinus carpio]|uniref:Amyloid-beta A4 precursor protein-binding family A member 1-like isoform X1 n=1 Tax=Cyprinus carpio TaxID=7962 RepID=A0A9Q9YI46_CYPCA|nr:amyloid-beta A4 precursor protein-binding family A member 1-like isoform X1 [Cyprinus carpio]XP_042620643.1 amyloid-beta A4 precursor protein-binding family A member 1-like isoform X1 [Cyprinus carpio]XP_042620644.1 amyloid-beta A4 precursor protein-binding family A member 1-like isoform X1 [Cyprinus carpio]XP_042620645.1 amyloid-beta A4 precursor protein-binding family A member 1-like isoform X1 [Cyprinus carpio]XP_042620646.1 amyloid-beta A4 precursor protein-binding family A member 1-like